jgi:hypothetical protein
MGPAIRFIFNLKKLKDIASIGAKIQKEVYLV